MTLEMAIEYIKDDEYVEITPKSIPLRKNTSAKMTENEIEIFKETEKYKNYTKKHSIEKKRRKTKTFGGKRISVISKNIRRRKKISQQYIILKAKQILQRGRIVRIYKTILARIICFIKYLYRRIAKF